MVFPIPSQLAFPVQPYAVNGYRFGQRLCRRILLWATHLGDDVVLPAGTPVRVVGEGNVVWAEVRAGSQAHRNWGGLVVVAHTDPRTHAPFYSVYGHLRDLPVTVGQRVPAGTQIGVIAASHTPENGWWKIEHLHFAIYVGPWRNTILPGYKRPEEWRTRMKWWRDPGAFIEAYNRYCSERTRAQ